MRGLRSLVATALALFLVFSFVGNCGSAAPRLFERRNWTPQAMLYLKGAQGRRFISDQSRRKDRADRPPPKRRSPSSQLLSLPEAAPVRMAPLQTHGKLEKKTEQMRFVEDSLLYGENIPDHTHVQFCSR